MPQYFRFFQQAMLALLGSKDISQGLVNLFSVLHGRLSLDALTFDRFDESEKRLDIHYVVTHAGFFEAKLSLPLSCDDEAYIRRNEAEMLLHQNASSFAIPLSMRHSEALAPYVPVKERAYMVGVLQVEGRIIGHLTCLGQKVGSFHNEHGRLLTMILPGCALAISNVLDLQSMHRQNAVMKDEQGRLQRELSVLSDGEMVGAQGGLSHVVSDMRKLANLDTPVLILGETGTGKELVADAIQKYSSRHDKPYVKINCGALTDTLLDSELFGHEKGAFTGALACRQGRFEQADGGTLLLDEVGELSPQAQVRLLRVLQDGIVERIGGRRPFCVDVRIIAATNRDLEAMCRQGLFREDLFHRLNVFPLHLPPLRKRREDLPLLVRHLAWRAAQNMGVPQPVIRMSHMDRLMSYTWPGNVRELKNLVERALILSNGAFIDLELLLPEVSETFLEPETAETIPCAALEAFLENKFSEWQHRLRTETPQAGAIDPARESTAEQLREVLAQCNGKIYGPGGAAERLGVNHNTLRSRMRRLGILPLDRRKRQLPACGFSAAERLAGDHELSTGMISGQILELKRRNDS